MRPGDARHERLPVVFAYPMINLGHHAWKLVEIALRQTAHGYYLSHMTSVKLLSLSPLKEEDTYAARHLDDSIPDTVKQSRLDQLMALQEKISLEIQESKVGSTMRVVVDREEPDYYIGRTEYDSPEVDPEVLIEKQRKLKRGEYLDVEITSALPFELIGRPV